MSILDGIETSAPTAVVVILTIAVLLSVAVLLIICFNAIKNASYKRWQSEQGIPPELQWGKSGTYYVVLILGWIAIIIIGPLIGLKVIEGLDGAVSEVSTVQTEAPKER